MTNATSIASTPDRRQTRNRRLTTLALVTIGASIALAAGHSTVGVAHADTGLKSIVCGAQKFGDGWQTNPVGGIDTGEGGCGPGIDYVSSPVDAYPAAVYDFGIGDSGYHEFQAWIPTVHATTPDVEFDLYADPTPAQQTGCPGFVADAEINEFPVSGWQNLFQYGAWNAAAYPGCHITIAVHASATNGNPNVGDLGLDAIRSHN